MVYTEEKKTIYHEKNTLSNYELDGVGPVDNKPSPNKLPHFVKKKRKEEEKKKSDMWHLTPESDTCHVTRYTWLMTYDTWHVKHG